MSDDTTEYPSEQDLITGIEALKAVEGRLEPDPEPGELSVAHADYLSAHAVDVELARSLGVRTLASPADTRELGEPWDSWANFPAILFPWTGPDGRTEYQVRPDNPNDDARGRPRKYVFRKGMIPVLWAVRPVEEAEKVLIVEGTKQCLAAASYAPPGVAVYGIAGCRMWQSDGIPIPDLGVVDGRDVVIILDADAASNAEVYSAGMDLAEALAIEGAASVRFGRLPATGKAGLDDVLASRAPERRAGYLARVIDAAKAKPADTRPKPKKKVQAAPGDTDRKTIICNRDRLEVINDLTAALIEKWDGRELFNHGGTISRLRGTTMVPIDRGTSRDLIQETAITVNEVETAQGITYDFTWPDVNSIAAVFSRAEKFSPLERVTRAPFVRPDGTICTKPGYDEATRTMLIPDPELTDIEVPEDPSPEEVAAARELIMIEWLGDFPFDGDPDRANALGLVVTPAIRGLVPRVPLAVVDGLQMGVGKNLFADSILTVYTGEPARPMNFVDEKEELRKQITSAFRTGAEFFVFDEAHTIDGTALAQALTASTWQDRILGFSTMAHFPNRVTWISLGNQVQVRGDLTRRVYRIALRPRYANPQDRPASSFRHPGQSGLDLGSWTRKHRRDLLRAILTLVRAWFAAGCPTPARGVSFGSFEPWERIVGGIVETAGLPGFLDNLTVWRSESDFDTQYWTGHLRWLAEQFGDRPFRTAEVRAKALADPAAYMAPPKLDDPAEKGYTKALGEAYSRLRGRWFEGVRIERQGSSHGHVSLWRVFTDEEPTSGQEGAGGTPDGPPDDCPQNPSSGDGGTGGTGASPELRSNTHTRAHTRACDKSGGEERVSGVEVGDRSPGPPVPPGGTAGYSGDHGVSDELDRGGRGCNGRDPGDGAGPEVSSPGAVPEVPGGGSERGQGSGASGWVRSQAETGRTDAPEGSDQRQDDSLLAPVTHPPITAELVTFDLETGDAADLYRYPDPKAYVRLPGWAVNDGPVQIQAFAPDQVAEAIRSGRVVTGHNIMAFDLPALVRAGALTMTEVHQMAKDGRLFDSLLAARHLDPPMARDKGVDATRRYDLDTLGRKFELGAKTAKASDLAKQYGGYDQVPVEDPTYREYLAGDVELSRKLYHHFLAAFGGTIPPYLVREHRVAALAAQISINGFRVDVPELQRRVAEIEARKAKAMEVLAGKYGIPTHDAKGRPYKSPLGTKDGKAALEKALREAGATSIWRTEKTGQIDVSAEHMDHLSREYAHLPEVREIAKCVYRIVSARTVYETVARCLHPDGRVHPRVAFKQATGRWSLTEPGLTVMGKRGGRHVEREVFLPDPGEVVLAVDLSQVDMRAVAGLSQDRAYIEMLTREDPHLEIAKALFGDPRMREKAKAIGHGWNYGRGIKAISEKEEIDLELVRQFDASMRERFPRLVEWQTEVRALAESGALLDNGFGRPMRPDPQRAHTQGPALMGQGAARDIMMEGLLRLADRAPEVLPMLRAQVHDEIVLSVPEKDAMDIARIVVEALTFEWRGVPILAEASPVGRTWGHVYSAK